MKKIITIAILSLPLFSFDYMADCTVPNVLIKTVQLTENETTYPYLIRVNSQFEKFKNIVERFTYKNTDDKNVEKNIGHNAHKLATSGLQILRGNVIHQVKMV